MEPEPESSSGEEAYDDIIDEEEDSEDEDENDEEEGDYIEGEDQAMESDDNNDDEDGDEDDQDEFMAAAEHDASSKPQNPMGVKNSSLYKAPTNDEIQGLQESSDLFKSNIFKLQIEELLKEVQIDYKKAQPLEAALRKLKEIFDRTPAHQELSVSTREYVSLESEEGYILCVAHDVNLRGTSSYLISWRRSRPT